MMQLSVYVIYELLIRLQVLNPAVGEYLTYKKINGGISVRTTTGHFNIADVVLDKQFHRPELVSTEELSALLESFEFDRKT
ncbi:hypothetical protein PBAL39_16921 [Pedobacter sp. BAL39]|uniref:hypothetical protein n=1 Tax=Pedobacter sp. BAL39 TaxID=391596 RepID=UPI0001559462|nr:hypothetical protein [Pedobacter sp. BAL39]EDM35184.1 hypothetical protein PBAL39_16921 [Pedobacter sp. BAL39]